MGAIKDAIDAAARDFNTDGVAASGLHQVDKSEVRAIGPVVETAIGNAGLGALIDVTYATRAALDADLVHAAGTVGLVYADAAGANNDLYVKTGASGGGAWTLTTILHDIVAAVTSAAVADAEAAAAAAAASAADALAAAGVIVQKRTPIYEVAFDTPNGNAGGIDQQGTLRVRGARVDTVNDLPARGLTHRREISHDFYRGAIHFMPWCGQSLQGGNAYGANHTTEQEYGLVAFARQSTSPGAYVDALASSETATGDSPYGAGYPNGEMPMFGASYLGELIEWRDGIRIDDIALKPLLCCDATGGTTIAGNSQGTANYDAALTQVTSAKTIALAEGWPLVARAVFWNQGESDDGSATYGADLVQLQTDYDTDIRAITGGADPVKLIVNQTNSVTGLRSSVARAQFDMAAAHADIVLSTPKYMMDYADNWHVMARDAKWIGAYDILAYLWEVIEGETWQPLTFSVDHVIGNFVTLKVTGNHGPLVLDETFLAPQTKAAGGGVGAMVRGFTALNGALAAVNVLGVELAGDSRVRVQLAAYAPGYRIGYAIAPAVSRPSPLATPLLTNPYAGGAGNLRDSLGDSLPLFRGNGVNRKMHKWAPAQEIIL